MKTQRLRQQLKKELKRLCAYYKVSVPKLVLLQHKYDDEVVSSYYNHEEKKIGIDVIEAKAMEISPKILLAHEFRHHYQEEKKLKCRRSQYSERAIIKMMFDKSYFKLPWEMDANNFEKRYAEKHGLNKGAVTMGEYVYKVVPKYLKILKEYKKRR